MGTSPAWSSSQPWLLSGEGLGLCQTLRDSGHCSSEWAAAHPDELGVGFFLPSFPKPFLSPPLTKSWSSEGNLFSPPLCSECSTSYQPTRRPDCSHSTISCYGFRSLPGSFERPLMFNAWSGKCSLKNMGLFGNFSQTAFRRIQTPVSPVTRNVDKAYWESHVARCTLI